MERKLWSPNNERNIDEFLASSTYPALWLCPTCNGEYILPIRDKVNGSDTCPFCTGKKLLPNFNSFKIRHSDLMEEWDFVNNYLLCKPDEILETFNKKTWWNCKNCNKKYYMSPKRRVYYKMRNMISCTYCKGLRRNKKYYF